MTAINFIKLNQQSVFAVVVCGVSLTKQNELVFKNTLF
jgi:hypothetical protein